MQLSSFRLIVAGVVAATGLGIAGAGAASADQVHMVNARDELNQAADQLQQAEPDKDGHREQAIELIRQAIDQVNQGIQAGREHDGQSAGAPAQQGQPAFPGF